MLYRRRGWPKDIHSTRRTCLLPLKPRPQAAGVEYVVAWQFFAASCHFLTANDADIVTLLKFFRSSIWITGKFSGKEGGELNSENQLSVGNIGRVVRKIESSRRDGKSNRGDFLIFVFLMLVKLSYMRSEKLAHLTE